VICLLPAKGHLTRTTRLRITTRWVTQNEQRNREAVPRRSRSTENPLTCP
jgi:hypothetical protein